ncbi:MAG: SufS family cysteine desulfurase, partial [Ignavibacteriae bacterium]|nr:SufS family cysteine desulfurase [Ignavibacteriota bacterium]
MNAYDVNKIRKDFPILQTQIYGKPLVYLDNAATTQKPQCVISAIDNYYCEINSNVHRGVHFLSEKATSAYEHARETISSFINAARTSEIIFVRGTTEAINLVANCYGNENINEGDEIIISALEHHSNIVPWQMLCERKNAVLRIIPINDNGELLFKEYENLFSERTKFVSVSHVSNSLGTINPVKRIIDTAHKRGVPVMIDGAQAVQHLKVDVRELDADFYAFSGHKLYGPTGIGVLYGKEKFLENMPPYQGGGDMIKSVSFEKTIYNDLPYKFEAGTPDISGAIGLAAAINYVTDVGLDNIAKHEKEVLGYATKKMLKIDGLRIIGKEKEKSSVLSFLIGNIHPYDAGTILDRL